MPRSLVLLSLALCLLLASGVNVAGQQTQTSGSTIPATQSTPESAPVPAATPGKNDEPLPFTISSESDATVSAPSAAGLIFKTLGALMLIVGLIVAGGWTLRKVGGGRFGARPDAPELLVLNSLSLGDKRSLAIVRFADRTLLLGSTPHAITLLAETDFDSDSPQPRSVADLLDADQTPAFADELLSATKAFDENDSSWQGEPI